MAKRIFLPVNGMNDKDNVILQNIMTEIINMEVRKKGQLEKRIEQQTFSADLNTKIAAVFTASVLPIDCTEPFYPARIPDVMLSTADYMIPVFGTNSGGDYMFYLFYEESAGVWGETRIDLESSGIEYGSSSNIIVKYVRDMLLILDYDGDNEPHYVTVNEDKEIVYDLIKNSVARPDRAPSFSDIDDDTNKGTIFTSTESDGFSSPKLFKWFYTIVNIFGDEGNPSPGSLIYDLAFKSTSTDKIQQQWVEGVFLGGLSLPVGATDKMKEEAEKYRLYRQECEDGAAYSFTQPQFVAEIDILNVDGETSYLDTITVGSSSPLLSFSNNRAPIARDAELVGESIMLSKLKLRAEVIASFDYLSPIKITNPNSETYPHGRTVIRLDYSAAGTGFPVFSWLLANKDKLRLFDSDLASPIPVIYDDTLIGSNTIDIIADIPMFEAGQQRKLYLTYCLSSTGTAGITPLPHWDDNGEYGEFQDYMETDEWLLQKTFTVPAIVSGELICSPMDIFDKTNEAFNKANELNYGSIESDAALYPTTIQLNQIPILATHCYNTPMKSIKMDPSSTDGVIRYYNTDNFEELELPTKFTISFKIMFDLANLLDNHEEGSPEDFNGLFYIWKDANETIQFYLHYNPANDFATLYYEAEDAGGAITDSTNVQLDLVSGNNIFDIKVTFDLISETAYVFALNMAKSNEFRFGDCSDICEYLIDWGATAEVVFGVVTQSIQASYYTDLHFLSRFFNIGADADNSVNSDDASALVNMANYMPVQRTSVVGYQQVFGRYRGSKIAITGADTITIDDVDIVDEFDADQVYIDTPPSGTAISPPSDDCGDDETGDWAAANGGLGFNLEPRYDFTVTTGATKATFSQAATAFIVGNTYRASFALKVGDSTNEVRINALTNAGAVIENGNTVVPTAGWLYTGFVEWVATEVNNKIEIEVLAGTGGDGEYSKFMDIAVTLVKTPNDGILAEITNVALVGSDTVITVSTTLTNEAKGSTMILTAKKRNNNIVLDTDDIELIEYKEHKNTAMFTNPNGMSFPPGNIKIADFPILRQIKTPTTLAEMRNSLLWFYRNGFTRYIADGDPSTWADATNLKIPQLAGRGLPAEKSLALTAQGVVWFAEKGIQLLNGLEPVTISEGLDIPIKDTYTHWYCSLTKQYALHDNDFIDEDQTVTFLASAKTIVIDNATTWASLGIVVGDRIAISGTSNNEGYLTITAITTKTATVSESVTNENSIAATIKISKDWVINLVTREPTTFRSLDILSAMSISGGNTIDNVIIALNQFGEIDLYPDYDDGSYTTGLSRVKKVIQENYADFVSILAKYGKTSGNVQIQADIEDPVGDLTDTLEYTDLEDFRTKVLPINFIGNKLTIELRDAETLEYFIVDIGEMLQPI